MISPLFVGLLLAAGVFFIYWSFWPQEARPRQPRQGGFMMELRDHLTQAGYSSVTPANVVLGSVVLFVVAFMTVLAVTRVVPIALCFSLMAGALPLSLVRMRARKRRNKLRDLWPDVVDNITSGVRAGLALPEALSQLAVRGPAELRPAFVAELNARKVPTPRGKEWSNKTLKQVVVRPRNAGLISTGPADRYGMEILGKAQWPAIVDEDTFLAVRDMLMEPSRRSSFTTEVSHLGSGLYLCGRCGAPLRPGPLRPRKGATKDEPTRFQYRCTENLHLTITEEPTDEYVRAEVAEIVRDPRIVAALGATQNEEAAALMESDRRQRNVLSARLAKFEDDYSQGLVSGTQLAKATARVKSEMEEVDRRISEAVQHSVASPVFSASDPGQAFLDSPIDVQRLVLASVAKVEILPSGPGVKWSTDRIRISPVSTAEAGDP